MHALLSITKALADDNRLRVMRALTGGELCVCQITELLSVATPTVSRHLSILQAAGLVDSRKQGRWVYYRLPDHPSPDVTRTLDWLDTMYNGAATTAHHLDTTKLHAIRCCDPETLCRRQKS